MNFFVNEDLLEPDTIEVVDDQVHHFKNVSRGKVGDKVKVLNGRGVILVGVVKELKKKSLQIEVTSKDLPKRKRELGLILGIPKREYLDSILRSSVQLGIKEIYLIHTRFSPQKYKKTPRQDKILKAAVTQSENPWMPEVTLLDNLTEVSELKGNKLLFSTEINEDTLNFGSKVFRYFVIGPEGGFHSDEIDHFKNCQDIDLIHCPTAIMKAETAVPYAAGLVDSLDLSFRKA